MSDAGGERVPPEDDSPTAEQSVKSATVHDDVSDATEETDRQRSLPRQFGDYELQEEIARGGMGVVYKARQVKLDRTVAVKMILASHLASDSAVARFYAEAESAGVLDHPNIVPVHDVGEIDGQHYLSMGFVDGGSLRDRLRHGPLPPSAAAQLMRTIAAAVQYAHEKGIVHRDLKPSNVLIDADGKPRITDFGLAKRVDSDTAMTRTGEVMGTPSYMPPEQARGEVARIGPRSDVYSLGAILYALLTGRPPFQAASLADTLILVINEEPVPPRQLSPTIPRDLETICLKCLEKEPERRYASARDLSDDLVRYLNDEPIAARPVGRVERCWRWCKRHPARTGFAAVGVLALMALVGLGVALNYQAELEGKNDALNTANRNISAARDQLKSKNVQLDTAFKKEAGLRSQLARKKLEVEFLLYRDQVKLALSEWEKGEVGRARTLLASCPQTLRGWEWHYACRVCNPEMLTLEGHTGETRCVAFSPDGKTIASGGGRQDKTVRIWNARTGQLLHILNGHTDLISCVAYSPDGSRIASAGWDGSVKVWNAADGRCLITYAEHPRQVKGVSFNYLGTLVACCSFDGSLQIFNAKTGKAVFNLPGRGMSINSVAFRPKGTYSTGNDIAGAVFSRLPEKVHIWDSTTGKERARLKGPISNLSQVEFDTYGRRIAAAGYDQRVWVWDVVTGKSQDLCVPGVPVHAVAFGPKAMQLAVGMEDGTVRIWTRPESGGEQFSLSKTLRGHTAPATSVDYGPAGKRVVSGCRDGKIRIWNVEPAKRPITASRNGTVTSFVGNVDRRNLWAGVGQGRPSSRVAVSRNWKRIANVCRTDKSIRLWNAADGMFIRTLERLGQDVFSLAISDDGALVAAGLRDNTVKVWDALNGEFRFALTGHSKPVNSIAFRPDGKQIVTAGYDQTLRVWSSETGQEVGRLSGHFDVVWCVAFGPRGRLLASAGGDRTVRVWDLQTLKTVYTFRGHDASVLSLCFSGSSNRIASGSRDGVIRIWDTTTGNNEIVLRGHTDGILDVEFGPDGRLASKGMDRTIRVWESATGHEMLSLKQDFADDGPRSVADLTFSKDGKRLAAVSAFRFRIWDARSGQWPDDRKQKVVKKNSKAATKRDR